MKVLIACEESGTCVKAFREIGHEAWSCDILDTSGEYPEYHIKDDVLNIINDKWDMMLAFPSCTFLCNSGVCHLHSDRPSTKMVVYGKDRWVKMYEACMFFKKLLYSPIPKIAVENPIPHKYARGYIGRYTQVIQPWMFGHKESKATCLWLKGLPKLSETDNVKVEMSELQRKESQKIHWMSPGPERAKKRSITFTGIANAMATQWNF
jgi:hypothetical protein